MLFFVVAALFVYSLATFGAVQPGYFLLLRIALVAITAGVLTFRAFRQRSWPIHLVFVFAAGAAGVLLDSRFLIAASVGLYAWIAARNERATVRFFKLLVVIGLIEALFGFVQSFITPGWILGYINPYYRVSGTLINRNHFAGLLEMLVPVSFGLAYIAARRSGDLARTYLYLFAGGVMGLALLLSTSRMGIMAFLVTTLFMGVLLQVQKTQRRLAAGFTLTLLSLVVAGAFWLGMDAVFQRYSELTGEEGLLREGRVLVYRDAVRMVLANPWGVGIGNFEDRFREYQTYQPNLLFNHAHNDYLEMAAEWGTPIASVFWIFIGFSFVRAVRLFISLGSPEQRGILLGCVGAIFSLLLHSLTDFNLQIPSNAILFLTFVGISWAISTKGASSWGDRDNYVSTKTY